MVLIVSIRSPLQTTPLQSLCPYSIRNYESDSIQEEERDSEENASRSASDWHPVHHHLLFGVRSSQGLETIQTTHESGFWIRRS